MGGFEEAEEEGGEGGEGGVHFWSFCVGDGGETLKGWEGGWKGEVCFDFSMAIYMDAYILLTLKYFTRLCKTLDIRERQVLTPSNAHRIVR